MSFPLYQSYKDSGVEWLGQVPRHWDVMRMANLFKEVIEAGTDQLPILSVSIHDGVSDEELSPDEMDRQVTRSEDRSKYKRVEPGDLVYNMMRAWQGGFGTVRVVGMVSPAYVVARPRFRFSTVFVEHLLRTSNAVEEMRRHSQGVTDFRLRLYWEQFKALYVSLPPPCEQSAIVTFLDHETAKIDALVEEQQRLIELLKEKRQAIISHAVTKGLDPNAAMKHSGVEWLGEVPAHWAISKFSREVYIAEGQVDPQADAYRSMLLIAPNHIESGTGQLKSRETSEEQGAESGKYLCKEGNVIYSKIRPALAKAAIAPENCLCSADMYPLNSTDKLTNPYLLWLLLSRHFTAWSVLEADRVAMPKINRETLSDLRLPAPPKTEQNAIAAFLSRETIKIDLLLNEATKSICLLQERRSALISAAVTGKIDVRGLVPTKAEAA